MSVTSIAAPVSTRDVLALQSTRGFPSLSVLFSTSPRPRMSASDAAGLAALIEQAEARLHQFEQVARPARLIDQLRRLHTEAAAGLTDHAVALYVNDERSAAFRLGVEVADRVVIDHTFATRDLVLSLQRTPRHVVLLLDSRQARLLESINGVLQPAATSAFPRQSPRPRRTDPNRPKLTNSDTHAFLKSVATALRAYRTLHPSPLVLLGPAPVLSAFLEVAGRPERLAGSVAGNYADAPLAQLTELTAPVIRQYLLSREQEALDLLGRRVRQRRAAVGMEAAWLAARTSQPEMLAVEQSLFYPATLDPDGNGIRLSLDVDQPDFLDDAVDELIEHVLIRGGWVAFVSDGALADYAGVALTRR